MEDLLSSSSSSAIEDSSSSQNDAILPPPIAPALSSAAAGGESLSPSGNQNLFPASSPAAPAAAQMKQGQDLAGSDEMEMDGEDYDDLEQDEEVSSGPRRSKLFFFMNFS